MAIRPRLLLILTALCVVPPAVLCVVAYRNGARLVEGQMREELQRDAAAIARAVKGMLREREQPLASLAASPALREYVRSGAEPAGPEGLPKELEAEARAFLDSNRRYYAAVTCYGTNRRSLFRAEPNFKGSPAVLFRTGDSPAALARPDERVWQSSEQTPLVSAPSREAYGSALRYTVPVFTAEAGDSPPAGALVVDLNLDAVVSDAAGRAYGPGQARRLVLVLDRSDAVIYHANVALKYQAVTLAMPPSFKPAADAMREGRVGWHFYDSADGSRWLAAYEPVEPPGLSVAVAGDYSAAVRGLGWVGWLGAVLTIAAGLLAAGVLWLSLRRSARAVESVARGAAAIAGGSLDRRIEVGSGDETRLLAESFNAVTDRLREQMAREAEARQFESFMRLSAMLTHDLKNSILALSLLVQNMEQQFHREEFRADAMRSLTEATDKLRALVARLSEPVRSLSGEFGRPRPVDLVPVIRRAVARTAGPSSGPHALSLNLPESLVAVADEERIERVVENLVLNAVEAMGGEPGELKVEAGEAEEGLVFFSVSDTGPGMTEEFQRDKLFRPFSTTKANGIGLGLYASRELIRALGGRIEVESARGSGTTFRVVLPSGAVAWKRKGMWPATGGRQS